MAGTAASWQALAKVAPAELVEGRLRLHHAVQLAACAGQSLLPRQSDDRQMALTWKEGALLGEPLAGGFRVGLKLASLVLEIQDERGTLAATFPLAGRTKVEALSWLKTQLGDLGLDAQALDSRMPYDLPVHPVADGGPFAPPSESIEELARVFSNAELLLATLALRPEASPLRCWPHHFDLALLLKLDQGAASEDARSIGVGLSPGDDSYPEPYYYVSPWPYPKDAGWPELPLGHWHKSPWFGAVFTMSEGLAGPEETQQSRAETFLMAGVQACEGML